MSQAFRIILKKSKGISKEKERELINMLFFRPLEALRVMVNLNGEPRTTAFKKVSEKFGIVERSANDHVNKVIDLGFFTFEKDDNIYKNHMVYEWLWTYFLPLFPEKERQIIRLLLFGPRDAIDPLMLSKAVVYTRRMEEELRKDEKKKKKKKKKTLVQELGEQSINEIINIIWDIFENTFVKNSYSNTTDITVHNEEEIIAACFKKPLEILRILNHATSFNGNILRERVSDELGIAPDTARHYVNKVIKSKMLKREKDKTLSISSELYKWLWLYLIPIYSKDVQKALEIMLLRTYTKFTQEQLGEIKEYTKQVIKTLKDRFKYYDKNTAKRIDIILCDGVFGDEKIKTKLY